MVLDAVNADFDGNVFVLVKAQTVRPLDLQRRMECCIALSQLVGGVLQCRKLELLAIARVLECPWNPLGLLPCDGKLLAIADRRFILTTHPEISIQRPNYISILLLFHIEPRYEGGPCTSLINTLTPLTH